MKLTKLSVHYCFWFLLFLTPVSQAQSSVPNTLLLADDTEQKSRFIGASTPQNIPTLSIESLLEQFALSGSNQLFDGTFIYLFEDKVQTVKVHRKKNVNGQVVEEFVPMDGVQKKTSRLLENQYCSLDNEWQYQFQAISSSFPFRVNNHYQNLLQNYNFAFSGIETVAGISAISIIIKSKDPYRYGYQLWFEPKTATLLKYKLVDHNDQSIEQYLFTDIAIQERSDSPVNESQAALCHEQYKGMNAAFKEYFYLNKVPAGYNLVSFRKGTIYNTERQAYQFQLSDGLSSVSIFIEDKKDSNQAINGVVKLGPVNIAGKSVGKHQITIIGAIPIVSALHFIKAVKRPNHKVSKIND